MGRVTLVWFSIPLGFLWSLSAFAQNRTVAITVDDLPYASVGAVSSSDAVVAKEINRKILSALRHHDAPVTGFVIQTGVEDLGPTAAIQILRNWTRGEFDLGNHTYSHQDANRLSLTELEDETIKGETGFVPLMKQAGKKPEFFRFPMNHTGETEQKHEKVAAFLTQRGYRVATCTIDNSDCLFNAACVPTLAGHESSVRRLRMEYRSYTSAESDYYAGVEQRDSRATSRPKSCSCTITV